MLPVVKEGVLDAELALLNQSTSFRTHLLEALAIMYTENPILGTQLISMLMDDEGATDFVTGAVFTYKMLRGQDESNSLNQQWGDNNVPTT